MNMANYEIKPLRDTKENATNENLPREGLVHEVCREWLMHEDQALAHRLQTEEYQHHLGHNRHRNAILRKDTPRAKEEQLREDEEAARIQMQLEIELREQEMRDAAIAASIGAELDKEEAEKTRLQQLKDLHLAKKIVEEEKSKIRQIKEIRQVEREAAYLGINSGLDNVAILSRKDKRGKDLKGSDRSSSRRRRRANLGSNDLSDLSDFCIKPSSSMDEEEMRCLQESQDEELARLLQEQDLKRRGDLLQEDQLSAIEAQDKELAKVLQEQERAKAKKAREKARQKALLKQQRSPLTDEPESSPPPRPPKTSNQASPPLEDSSHYSSIPPRRSDSPQYEAPIVVGVNRESARSRGTSVPESSVVKEESSSLEAERKRHKERPRSQSYTPPPSTFPNIACAIDPTYQRRVKCGELSATSTVTSHHSYSPTPSNTAPPPPPPPEEYEEEVEGGDDDDDDDDDYLPPPYMPIQGQRRTASLEKSKVSSKGSKEKGEKGGCKQQ